MKENDIKYFEENADKELNNETGEKVTNVLFEYMIGHPWKYTNWCFDSIKIWPFKQETR